MKNIIKNGMPLGAPLAFPGPYTFLNSELNIFVFDTDSKMLPKWIPDGLALAEPANISIVIARHPLASADSWPEIKYKFSDIHILVPVTLQSSPDITGLFSLFSYSDLDVAFATGREAYGIPYKLGKINVIEDAIDNSITCELVRGGVKLITLKAQLMNKDVDGEKVKEYMEMLQMYCNLKETDIIKQSLNMFNFRNIPDVSGKGSQIMELTKTLFRFEKVSLAQPFMIDTVEIKLCYSDVDPIHELGEINKVIAALQIKGDFKLPFGSVVNNQLKGN
ncbi:MAG: acetoacetate decarboxylase family protein [Candidatus Anammoxibacter sp.]